MRGHADGTVQLGPDNKPVVENFATEQKWFPRADEQMPEWFRNGLAKA